jgi:hypothetical protein
MDIDDWLAQRMCVADAFRAKVTHLGMLRTQLANSASEPERGKLRAAIDEGAAACRQLGASLLEVDAFVSAQQRQAERCNAGGSEEKPQDAVDPRLIPAECN